MAVAPAPTKPEPPAATRRPVAVYTKIDYAWVDRHLVVDAAEMERWGAANASSLRPDLRHVLVRVPANATPAQEASAKKKATSILAQAKKGADFAKLAKTYSEDPSSKDRGGTLPGASVRTYVEEIQKAYASLAPGELDKELVRTSYGWHVLKKEKPTTANIEVAFRVRKSMAVATALAESLAEKLESRAPIHSLENAIREVVGPRAVSDAGALFHGVVSPNDFRQHAKLNDACASMLDVPENEVQLVAAKDGILVVRGDEGVPGRDTAEICPPPDVELADTEMVDSMPRFALLTAPLPRE